MSTVNYAFREVLCKIVYYGPGLGGKTTNLLKIHETVPDKHRGDLVSLATEQDRTLFFDFLPIDLGEIKGFRTKFQLYTVPGQVYYNATRKLVLRGVDGIVFVADSDPAKMDENIESLQNMAVNLKEYGYDPDKIPIVFQFNKRDLPTASPIETLNDALNRRGAPYFEGIAVEGVGVRETLRKVSALVLADLQKATRPSGSRLAAGVASDAPDLPSVSPPPRQDGLNLEPVAPAPSQSLSLEPVAPPPRQPSSLDLEPITPVTARKPAVSTTRTAAEGGLTGALDADARTRRRTAQSPSSRLSDININQRCDVYWGRCRAGRARVRMQTNTTFDGKITCSFSLDLHVWFLLRRKYEATMRHIGVEIRDYGGAESRFTTFGGPADDASETRTVFVWVLEGAVPTLFARYYGRLLRLVVTPEGEKSML